MIYMRLRAGYGIIRCAMICLNDILFFDVIVSIVTGVKGFERVGTRLMLFFMLIRYL